jgi:hypothetical protein
MPARLTGVPSVPRVLVGISEIRPSRPPVPLTRRGRGRASVVALDILGRGRALDAMTAPRRRVWATGRASSLSTFSGARCDDGASPPSLGGGESTVALDLLGVEDLSGTAPNLTSVGSAHSHEHTIAFSRIGCAGRTVAVRGPRVARLPLGRWGASPFGGGGAPGRWPTLVVPAARWLSRWRFLPRVGCRGGCEGLGR